MLAAKMFNLLKGCVEIVSLQDASYEQRAQVVAKLESGRVVILDLNLLDQNERQHLQYYFDGATHRCGLWLQIDHDFMLVAPKNVKVIDNGKLVSMSQNKENE